MDVIGGFFQSNFSTVMGKEDRRVIGSEKAETVFIGSVLRNLGGKGEQREGNIYREAS